MTLNRQKLADFLGCSLPTIDEYVRQGCPGEAPKHGGGSWKFESKAVVGWLRERERATALGEIDRLDEAEVKLRKLVAEAIKAEHEAAITTGAAVAISDFEIAHSAIIGAARAKFLGLGAALGPEVALLDDPHQCSLVIDAGIKEALRELSEPVDLPFEYDGEEESPESGQQGVPDLGTPAESDGIAVGR